ALRPEQEQLLAAQVPAGLVHGRAEPGVMQVQRLAPGADRDPGAPGGQAAQLPFQVPADRLRRGELALEHGVVCRPGPLDAQQRVAARFVGLLHGVAQPRDLRRAIAVRDVREVHRHGHLVIMPTRPALPDPRLRFQPPEKAVASASASEAGEQPRVVTWMCTWSGPGGCCRINTADSVRCGPAWPTATVATLACSWPRLARGTTTLVPPEVVTGTRVPPDVTTVKPPVPASATVPRATPQPGGGVTFSAPGPLLGPGGSPTVTDAAAIVPPERGPSAMTDAPSVMSLRSAPATLTFVDGVVVTVTGWPLAVLMTRLPFTLSSVPWASSSPAHPLTAVKTVLGACRVRAVVAQ